MKFPPRADVGATLSVLCAMLTLPLLAGCSREAVVAEPIERAVKIERVRSASADTAQLLGTERQHDRADLSFESGGRIARIDVDVGDPIRQGQIIATLDTAPAKLRLQQAEANVDAAAAQLAERRLQLDQQQALFADRMVSATVLESARSAYQSAVSQLRVARSNLKLAQREVRNSAIVAPFDGRIVARRVQPFADVAEGQVVLQVEGQHDREIEVMVPATMAAELTPGMHALARIDASSARTVPVVLTHISVRTDNGFLVQAVFHIDGADPALNSGTIVTVQLPNRATEGLPTVPPEALLMGSSGRQAELFVYNKNGRVTRRAVTLGAMINGRVLVQSGLSMGERVVVAGAPFLVDGQAVTVFQSASQLSR